MAEFETVGRELGVRTIKPEQFQVVARILERNVFAVTCSKVLPLPPRTRLFFFTADSPQVRHKFEVAILVA